MVPGTKSFLVMLTVFGEGGVCVALTCFTAVPLPEDLLVVVPLPGFNKLPSPVCRPQAERIKAEQIRTDINVKRFIYCLQATGAMLLSDY